jgi:hypothetical protein
MDIITAPYSVDVHQGSTSGVVSSQWFNRPDDQKFTNLHDLRDSCYKHAHDAVVTNVKSRDIRVIADRNDNDTLRLEVPTAYNNVNGSVNATRVVQPTNWSFGQVAGLIKAPAGYMRKLPASIAAINMQYGLQNHRQELLKVYSTQGDGGQVVSELRAATGPDYGRIYDYEVADAVIKIAGSGQGEERWKVPGMIDWANSTYNPNINVTKETTTLYASDRDIFLFLVDDRNPIEIGKLPNGDPDNVFRGFYVWNSEVGSRSFGLASFYLRGVCQNRCLWGVEGFQQVTFRHSKYAPERFINEASRALESYANASDHKLISGVKEAKEQIVARSEEGRKEFLQKRGFSVAETNKIIDSVMVEEGHPAESVWDFVQGITAVARDKPHQDDRVAMEKVAGRLLDKVA